MFKAGDRVKYVKPMKDHHWDSQYPPVGTLGTLTSDEKWNGVNVTFDTGHKFGGAIVDRFARVPKNEKIEDEPKTLESVLTDTIGKFLLNEYRDNTVKAVLEALNKNFNIV